jgi:lipopolysaccharide/colanic/teichoic acid biosynthesis glycosyltransferase
MPTQIHLKADKQMQRPPLMNVLTILGVWGMLIILVILTWFFIWSVLASSKILYLYVFITGCLIAGMVLILSSRIVTGRFSHSNRFRLSFMLSLCSLIFITLIPWIFPGRVSLWRGAGIFQSITPHIGITLLLILIGWLGAFIGSLVVTALDDGLWENNSPPAQPIQDEVIRLHAGRIAQVEKTPWLKRLFDILVSGTGLIISFPLWIVSLFVIWISDPGPVLFVKNSVGKGGRNFYQLKMRTMVLGAEDATGPVMAQEGDERLLWIGSFLRKTALDELPQLVNILLGQMSVVGPRPQRTVLVLQYLREMPEYAERHRVMPGLAGLAQVAGSYYLTPRQKLRFDRLYIHHQSLGFDLRLLISAFLIAFWFRWKKGWDGKLPRKLLHR